ncbi:hypothetical protein M885DRAFT_546896 [Pelagophyceae sp. CCMP2097]|nr:hypothetical protein M885DRAFT_546896 [Pelagophyceae sp. CCMP2097]|mmetsp:Transcript_15384/g.51823  ORF Transcript_15384/g.51823 Transcript_15384/m.51823 type:complete len:299 (+) Transcript_15384:164-1060(+)
MERQIAPEPVPMCDGVWRQTKMMHKHAQELKALASNDKGRAVPPPPASSPASPPTPEANAQLVADIREACLAIFATKDTDADYRVEGRSALVTYQRRAAPAGGCCLVATLQPVARSVSEAMARFEVKPDDFAWSNEHHKIWHGHAPAADIQSFKVVSDFSPNDQVFYVSVKEATKPTGHVDFVWLNSRHAPEASRGGIGVITAIPIETSMCPEKPDIERVPFASGGYVFFPLSDKTCGISRIVYIDRPPALDPLRCLLHAFLCFDEGTVRSQQRDGWIRYMHSLKVTMETNVPPYAHP